MLKQDGKKIIIVCLVIIIIALIITVLYFYNAKKNRSKDVIRLFDELDEITEIDVFFTTADGHEHVHVDKNQINHIVDFFENRKYVSGKPNNKDGITATIIFKDSNGNELNITIINSSRISLESSKNKKHGLYRSENINDDWRLFYPNNL